MTPIPILILIPFLFLETTTGALNLHPPCRHRHTTTQLYAGFGKPSPANNNKNKSTTPKPTTKKKLQVQERIKQAYGGDIAYGTQERIQTAINALPPHERSITDLYRKVAQWDAHIFSLSPERMVREVKSQDVANAEANRTELERLCGDIGWTEGDAHNVIQRITWDASADAKATKASVGFMPDHLQKRVDRACTVIADSVKSAKRRDGSRDGRCLDVGCGYGTLVPELTKSGVSPGQIAGVDLSEEMAGNARERYRGVTFVAGDFLGEGYGDEGGFYGVIFCSALHDFPDVERGLAKAAGLLGPEGKMVIL